MPNAIDKLAYFIYMESIKNTTAIDTFNFPNNKTKNYFTRMAQDIFKLYEEKTDKIGSISKYLLCEDRSVLNLDIKDQNIYITEAEKIITFLNKILMKYDKVVVYFDTSGSIDVNVYSNIIFEIMKKYEDIEIYSFDTEVYGPYNSHDDFMSNIVGMGGTLELPVVKNIIDHLGKRDTYEFIVVSDFYIQGTERYFNDLIKPLTEEYNSSLMTFDITKDISFII